MSYIVDLFHWYGIPVFIVKGDEGMTDQITTELRRKVLGEMEKGKRNFVFHFSSPMDFTVRSLNEKLLVSGGEEIKQSDGKLYIVLRGLDYEAVGAFTARPGIYNNLKLALSKLKPERRRENIFETVVLEETAEI